MNLFENRAGLKQFVKFCLIGALGVATNFSIVGWFIALVVVFALNRRFTFTSSGSTVGDFAKTLGVYSTQQLLVVAGLTVGVEWLQLSPTVSYALILPIAIAVSFLGLKFFAMR